MFQLNDILGQERIRYVAKHRDGRVFGSWWDGEDLTKLNEDGWNLYAVLNRTRPDFCGIKPSDKDIVNHTFFLVDLDPLTEDYPPTAPAYWALVEAVKKIVGIEEEDTFRQFTGRGLQCWIRSHPVSVEDGRSNARWLVSELSKYSFPGFRVDTSTTDASRLARFPNTINWKTKERGTPYFPVNVPSPVSRSRFGKIEQTTNPPKPNKNLTKLSELAPRLTLAATTFLLGGVEHDRHKNAHAAACSLRDAGVPMPLAEQYVLAGAERCKHPLDPSEAIHCVRTAYRAT